MNNTQRRNNNTSAQRRKAFRRALKNQPSDRFTEMMQAVTGGGAHPCDCCGLVYPVSRLTEGVCGNCKSSLGRIAVSPPDPRPPYLHIDHPNVVYVDASYRDGIAGLAVVGALGEHTQTVAAQTSTQAESLAMRWAMAIADERPDLIFRTDCEAVARGYRHWLTDQKKHALGWRVEQIPRRLNVLADALAGDTRMNNPLSESVS